MALISLELLSQSIHTLNMDQRLQGKIAVVTGASSGLGRAIAYRFAQSGARIVCADLVPTARPMHADASPPQPTHELINEKIGKDKAIFVKADCSSEEQVQALIAEAVKWGGRLDIMCNNAGIATEVESSLQRRIHETPVADYDRTHAINMRGVWLGCKYAVTQMLAQEPHPPNRRGDRTRGWIINTASMLGLVGLTNGPCYVPTKHGVVGITKSVALDYAKDKIHCNALCPGFVSTAMIDSLTAESPEMNNALASAHPWGDLGSADDVAAVALFLASEDSYVLRSSLHSPLRLSVPGLPVFQWSSMVVILCSSGNAVDECCVAVNFVYSPLIPNTMAFFNRAESSACSNSSRSVGLELQA
jgi:NAD(P)-dependent dehydrogenase (short-subunit alcohol dehydrogenase family)